MNTDLAGGLEIDLIRLLAMIKDIEREGRQGKCVINISMGLFVPEGATGRWMPLYSKLSLSVSLSPFVS